MSFFKKFLLRIAYYLSLLLHIISLLGLIILVFLSLGPLLNYFIPDFIDVSYKVTYWWGLSFLGLIVILAIAHQIRDYTYDRLDKLDWKK
jgi:preprotein translocase subunit SecG